MLAQDPVLLAGLLMAGAFIFMLVAWPLGRVIAQGFFTPEGQFSLEEFRRYVDPNSARHYWLIFYDTMRMGTLSVLFGTVLGFIFAYSSVNCDVPFKRLVRILALIPTISPPFSMAIAAILLFGRNGLITRQLLADTRVSGGFLYESTVHLLDMMRWLLGEVVDVECPAQSSLYNELDNFIMLLTFASGQHSAFLSCAHTSWAFPFERIELYGDHAQIITEEMEKVAYAPGLGQALVQHDFFQLSMSDKWGYGEEDTLFVDAILEDKSPPVTAEDGYKAIELVEACYRSAQYDGMRIRLPLEDRTES